jgi:hypothetical protein
MSEAAAELRKRAARWRLWAGLQVDAQAMEALLSVANELETRAAALEARQAGPAKTHQPG